MPKRSVFFISDWTGVTAETLGASLLAHFDGIEFSRTRLPFINDQAKAEAARVRLQMAQVKDGVRPIVLLTMVSSELQSIIESSGAFCLDLFGTFIRPLAEELQVKPSQAVGMSHRATSNHYLNRMDAINYALSHDDGQSTTDLDRAEVILVGVSRSGKTPTSLYLAMQFGVHASNCPLTPEDLERMTLPAELNAQRSKLFGLSIAPERLHRIRSERRPGSRYASLENCRREVRQAETLMRRENIPWIDSTSKSVEEIASLILQQRKQNSHG